MKPCARWYHCHRCRELSHQRHGLQLQPARRTPHLLHLVGGVLGSCALCAAEATTHAFVLQAMLKGAFVVMAQCEDRFPQTHFLHRLARPGPTRTSPRETAAEAAPVKSSELSSTAAPCACSHPAPSSMLSSTVLTANPTCDRMRGSSNSGGH